MKILRLKLPKRRPFGALFPYVKGHVFHVTKASNLDSILISGKIGPGEGNPYETTFGYTKNSFFRKRGCVSVFDYREYTSDHFEEFYTKCLPTMPARDGDEVAILIFTESICNKMISWKEWKREKAWGEAVVPYIEAGYPGPIGLEMVAEIIIVSITNTGVSSE